MTFQGLEILKETNPGLSRIFREAWERTCSLRFEGTLWTRLVAGHAVGGHVRLTAAGLQRFTGVVERRRRHHHSRAADEADRDVDVEQDSVDDLRQKLPVIAHLSTRASVRHHQTVSELHTVIHLTSAQQ